VPVEVALEREHADPHDVVDMELYKWRESASDVMFGELGGLDTAIASGGAEILADATSTAGSLK